MVKIIMNGCNGKMGQVICSLVEKDEDCEIVAGIDINPSNAKFPTFTNINDCNIEADVIIDFSTASAIPELLKYSENKKMPIVICTTGLDEKTLKEIDELSEKVPVFKSANMSLGINLIANLLKKATGILHENGFDIEIIEKHHNQKLDSPSGTALLLADTIKDSISEETNYVHGRDGHKKREKNEIGVHAVRGGSIVGDHDVIFAGTGEVIELSHKAISRDVFAIGALKACEYMASIKDAGLYNMDDVLGL